MTTVHDDAIAQAASALRESRAERRTSAARAHPFLPAASGGRVHDLAMGRAFAPLMLLGLVMKLVAITQLTRGGRSARGHAEVAVLQLMRAL